LREAGANGDEDVTARTCPPSYGSNGGEAG
jgi:hypothetical protein